MTESELKTYFNGKKQRIDARSGKLIKGFVRTTFVDFEAWIGPLGIPGQCHYCGISGEQCARLFQMQVMGPRYNATRGGKRGRRRELDRRDASMDYDDLNNLVWCCYSCNNAKSNFFSEEEFMPVAKAIGQVLQSILKEAGDVRD